MMKVLVACEYSGVVRDAFIAAGHDATSCDLLPSDSTDGPHYQGDVRDLLYTGEWDLMIAHPPCTHLAVSGARWFHEKRAEQMEALEFVALLMSAPIPRIALENPVSVISSRIRKPDQIVQPWQFGHGEVKASCYWLKNLPLLKPTRIVDGREAKVHRMPPSADRWKLRSATLPGIASAMATQWGACAMLPLPTNAREAQQVTIKSEQESKAPRKPRSASTCKATGDVFVCNLAPGHPGSHVDMVAAVMWDASVVTRAFTFMDPIPGT